MLCQYWFDVRVCSGSERSRETSETDGEGIGKKTSTPHTHQLRGDRGVAVVPDYCTLSAEVRDFSYPNIMPFILKLMYMGEKTSTPPPQYLERCGEI